MININNLTFLYPATKQPALNNINLNIAAGEFIGVIGPTGAGKSTFTLCLNGVIPHFQTGEFYGEVKINGLDTINHSCAALAGTIGSVFQDPESQIICSTVEDEIAFGLENLNIPRPEISQRIEESLSLVGISQLKLSSTNQLSGGQKQRVAIAAAMAVHPKILVLDEPTSELDPLGSEEIFQLLQNLNQTQGITIVIVEQKMQLLARYCSRLIVMDQGKIVEDGSSRTVLGKYNKLSQLGVYCSPVTQLVYWLKERDLYHGEFPLNLIEAKAVIDQVLAPVLDCAEVKK